jgi:dTDP-4-dehydrorhamnose reductase
VHVQDRTLVSTRSDVHIVLPSYPEMLAELAAFMDSPEMRT